MRPACPPLVFGCKYLNFSRSKGEMDLAARRAIRELEGDSPKDLAEYTDCTTQKHKDMVERICQRIGLTTLQYQRLDDMTDAIGVPRKKLCTYCWNGCEGCGR
jgi:amidophosphoribosyltransferase